MEYLKTDEYALAKAREENLLYGCKKRNWTIVRPYITYNVNRLQLGVYEKENWLNRALRGRTVVLPMDIAEKKTTLTYAPDVMNLLLKLIGNEDAKGEVFHIVTNQAITWEKVLEIYFDVIENRTGKRPKVKFVKDSKELQAIWSSYQIKYDRLYDREFCNEKIETLCGKYSFTEVSVGLEKCLNEFLDNPEWLGLNWRYEAWCDKIAGERTPLKEIPGIKTKLRYLKWRYL